MIDKPMYNSEGYPDPTAWKGIQNAERSARKSTFRPLVYICSPFSGDTERNSIRARQFSRFAVDSNCIPLAPHLLLPQYMSEEEERDLVMFMDLVLMGKCQEVWVLGPTITTGMSMEIERAKKRRQTVRYFDEEFREVEHV